MKAIIIVVRHFHSWSKLIVALAQTLPSLTDGTTRRLVNVNYKQISFLRLLGSKLKFVFERHHANRWSFYMQYAVEMGNSISDVRGQRMCLGPIFDLCRCYRGSPYMTFCMWFSRQLGGKSKDSGFKLEILEKYKK